jgi:hypothetical protein
MIYYKDFSPLFSQTKLEMFKICFDNYLKLYKCMKCGFVAQYSSSGNFTLFTTYGDKYSLAFVNEGKEFRYPNRP